MRLKRMYSSAAVLLVVGCPLALSAKADDSEVLKNVLEGRTYGGLDHFYVSKKDHDLIGDQLPMFPRANNTYLVDRKEDPDQIKCMQEADAGWIIGVLKATIPGSSIPSAVFGNTKFGKIPDCNAQWHDKVYKIAVSTQFSM